VPQTAIQFIPTKLSQRVSKKNNAVFIFGKKTELECETSHEEERPVRRNVKRYNQKEVSEDTCFLPDEAFTELAKDGTFRAIFISKPYFVILGMSKGTPISSGHGTDTWLERGFLDLKPEAVHVLMVETAPMRADTPQHPSRADSLQ
jgi:hypothetical protein